MKILTAIDREEISRLREAKEFFWLDLRGPDDAALEELQDIFGLHGLVLEDIRERNQRPKLDDYEDYVVLVFYGAHRDEQGRPALIEVELIISGEDIITVRPGHCEELNEVQRHFAEHAPRSEQWVVYRVIDALTDSFFPILADMDDEIDQLESEIADKAEPSQLHRISGLRRDLMTMRKVITPQRDIFARAGDDITDLPGLEPEGRDHFRDVYDHLIRISDLIDSYRDLLSGTMDVYLSTVSNDLNVVMERLTLIATIFLPLTVVTGFFGQNFGWLTGHIGSLGAFLVLGVGGMVVPIITLLAWFKRRGWI